MISYMNKEIEARFLDIDKQKLVEKLKALGARDKGDVMLTEVIFYDADNTWPDEGRFVRVRSSNSGTILTYKHNKEQTIDSAREIEFAVPEATLAEQFLENIGLVAARHQEKYRHTFEFNDVTIDIDTWPRIPSYVELEGNSEDDLKAAAKELTLDWNAVELRDPKLVIEQVYKVPVGKMKWFTFDRFE